MTFRHPIVMGPLMTLGLKAGQEGDVETLYAICCALAAVEAGHMKFPDYEGFVAELRSEVVIDAQAHHG